MSGPETNRKLEEILIRALQTPADQLEDYLQQACGPDDAMRERIWKMVRGREFDSDETETTSAAAHAPGSPQRAAHAPGSPQRAAHAPGSPQREIGPYTLHSLLGSGTFGDVWLATRNDDLKRRVAIKILKPFKDQSRFRAETQYLALLNHPNIVKVFDFGQTGRGEMYCVMEYVEGQDLTTFCGSRRLALRARVELFQTICRAVSAAHRVPLVHRDLKPDNIRVTPEGEPKLLDFGLARLLHQELALNIKPPTLPGTRAGTWLYASPEQLNGAPVTTSTDVYSLGVILYELLVGQAPFLREGMTLAEFTRAVMEETPPAPSKSVLDSSNTDAIASGMQVSSGKALARELSGELDSIVLMALRKEPERRYTSAEAFAADVRAYLTGYPVEARPDSFLYRTRKLVGRHRALALVSTLAAASIVGGLVATTYQKNKAEQARQSAEQSLHRMQLESAALQDALDSALTKSVPDLPQLSRVEDAQQQLATNPSSGPARARLAEELRKLYEADEQAGDFQSALEHCRQSAQVQKSADVSDHCVYLQGRADAAKAGGMGAFGDNGSTQAASRFDPLPAARNYLVLGRLRAAGGDHDGARDALNRSIVLFEMAGKSSPSEAVKQGLEQARAERARLPQ